MIYALFLVYGYACYFLGYHRARQNIYKSIGFDPSAPFDPYKKKI